MKKVTVYYTPAIPWSCLNILIAVEFARLRHTREKRCNISIVCLPESMKPIVPHIAAVVVDRADEVKK